MHLGELSYNSSCSVSVLISFRKVFFFSCKTPLKSLPSALSATRYRIGLINLYQIWSDLHGNFFNIFLFTAVPFLALVLLCTSYTIAADSASDQNLLKAASSSSFKFSNDLFKVNIFQFHCYIDTMKKDTIDNAVHAKKFYNTPIWVTARELLLSYELITIPQIT